MQSPQSDARPLGVRLSAAFFVLAGLVEILMPLLELRPLRFLPLWDAGVRGGMDLLLAAGLWRRLALCRSIAMIYCLATVITYAVAMGFALGDAPLRFPLSIVVQSVVHVPAGVVLFLYLRSTPASAHFPRRLFAQRHPPTPTDRACSGRRDDL